MLRSMASRRLQRDASSGCEASASPRVFVGGKSCYDVQRGRRVILFSIFELSLSSTAPLRSSRSRVFMHGLLR